MRGRASKDAPVRPRWSDQTDNASHRDLMVRFAKRWMSTAAAIERRVAAGDRLAARDLRNKLD